MNAGGAMSAALRARAQAPQLALLRVHRASRLPPWLFGILCGLATTIVVISPLWFGATGDVDGGNLLSVGCFFGLSLGIIAAVTPRVFPAAVADLERLGPVLDLTDDERALVARALVRMPHARALQVAVLGLVLGIAHSALLGQLALPPAVAFTETLGTAALWIAMFLVLMPLLQNASLFSALGARCRPDLLAPARLAPFGATALRPTLFVVGLQAVYPVLVLFSDQTLAAPTLIGLLVSLSGMVGLFFLPLRGVRRRIASRRSEALVRLDARIGALRDTVGTDYAAAPLETLRNLEALLALRTRIAAVSSWPLDLAGVRRVLLYVVLPPLTWAMAAVVELVIDRTL